MAPGDRERAGVDRAAGAGGGLCTRNRGLRLRRPAHHRGRNRGGAGREGVTRKARAAGTTRRGRGGGGGNVEVGVPNVSLAKCPLIRDTGAKGECA